MTVAAATGAASHLGHLAAGGAFVIVALAVAAFADRRERNIDARHPTARWRTLGARATSALVIACGGAEAGAAAVHFVVMPEHFEEAWLYGAFFLVTAAVQLALAAALLVRPARRLLLIAAVANVGMVLLWLTTRLIAIPLGPSAGTTEGFGALDVLASSMESAAVVTAVLLLAQNRLSPRRRLSHDEGLRPHARRQIVEPVAAARARTGLPGHGRRP